MKVIAIQARNLAIWSTSIPDDPITPKAQKLRRIAHIGTTVVRSSSNHLATLRSGIPVSPSGSTTFAIDALPVCILRRCYRANLFYMVDTQCVQVRKMAKETVVVESRVRELLPEGIRLSSDAIDGLDLAVKKMIENAVARCQANKRKTVIKEDF